jgi:hypothetical protein
MAYQTIVAVFDTATHAARAVAALKAEGFAADDISVFDRDRFTSGRATAAAGTREPGLWHGLFGGNLYQHEAQVYGQAVEEVGETAQLFPTLRGSGIFLGRGGRHGPSQWTRVGDDPGRTTPGETLFP